MKQRTPKHHRIILPISGCMGPRLVPTSNNHSCEEMDTVGSEDVAEKHGENMVREKRHIHTKTWTWWRKQTFS